MVIKIAQLWMLRGKVIKKTKLLIIFLSIVFGRQDLRYQSKSPNSKAVKTLFKISYSSLHPNLV